MTKILVDAAIIKTLITEAHASLEDAAFRAVKKGNIPLLETVFALVEDKTTPERAFNGSTAKQFIQDQRDELDDNLLTLAARSGQPKVIDYLVSKGADVNAPHPDGTGHTALMAALEYPSCVAALLKHGANPNQATSGGYTPLMEAVCAHKTKSIKMLLEHGANPNARTADGSTALHFATDDFYGIDSADCLIKAGADVNAVAAGEDYFKTPLTNAIAQGSVHMVELLLEKGADPTITHTNGRSSALRTAQIWKTSYPKLLPIIEKAIAAWPSASGAANDAPVAPLDKGQRPSARVHRLAV